MSSATEPSLTDRQGVVLRTVVEQYVETSHPIGSEQVADSAGLEVSSATIRKEMLALEDGGFLYQPHTSAGRIPTEAGYRYFVDTVVAPAELGGSQQARISSFFDQAHGELERLLSHTSSLLADLTSHTAVLIGPTAQAETIRSAQLVWLSTGHAMAIIVTSSGRVDKHAVELDDTITPEVIDQASVYMNAQLSGSDPDAGLTAELSGDVIVDAIVSSAIEGIASHPADSPLYLGGTSQVAKTFDAIDTVRGVLAVLEKQLVVVNLIRDVLDRGLRVAIGTETGYENLNECSLVVSEYLVDGVPSGSIGLLGPTRMDYSQAMAAVAVVGRELGTRLSEG